MFQIVGFPHWIKQRAGDLLTFLDFSLQEAYEAKRQEFYLELQRKEEEMRQQFVQRVKEKEAILKEAEQQVSMPVCLSWVCLLRFGTVKLLAKSQLVDFYNFLIFWGQ